jgi:precorrin-3B methylase
MKAISKKVYMVMVFWNPRKKNREWWLEDLERHLGKYSKDRA